MADCNMLIFFSYHRHRGFVVQLFCPGTRNTTSPSTSATQAMKICYDQLLKMVSLIYFIVSEINILIKFR